MSMKKRVLAVAAICAFPLLGAQAQMQLPAPSGSPDSVPIGVPSIVGPGNTYEREVTPLLRDVSKKKTLLELRRLDRELEKLEEEALAAQIERDKALNPPLLNVNPNSPNFGQAMPVAAPPPVPAPAPAPTVEEEEPVRVLMVYGSDNDLYAKVSHGNQGGYVVRKGDVLPDGRLITNITPTFLEFKKVAKGKKSAASNKLFVLGPMSSNNSSSSSIRPSAPSGLPSVSPGSIPAPVAGPTNTAGTTMLPPPVAPNGQTSSTVTLPGTSGRVMR